MKRLTKITIPALAVLMTIAPSFSQTYVHLDLPTEKKEEPVKRVEPIEPLKIEPKGIELKKVEIPKLEIKQLAIPKAVINLDAEDEEIAEDKKEEEEKEKVEVVEDKKEEEEKIEVAEDKKEEEEKVEITKTEVVRNTTYEELTGLVCRQQQQLDKVTTSIDSLIKSMDKQLELINSLTQLMMANQLATNTTPQYGPNLFQQPTLMSNYEAMLFGQRMGSLMNIFSPVQSFNGFGLQQAQAPNYTYNYYGPQQPQQVQPYQPQQQVIPQYAPYNFGNVSGGSIDNSTRTMEYMMPGQQASLPAMQTYSI